MGADIIKESLQREKYCEEIISLREGDPKNVINSEDFDNNATNVVICMSQDASKVTMYSLS